MVKKLLALAFCTALGTGSAMAQTFFVPTLSYPNDLSWIRAIDPQRSLLYLNDGMVFRLGPSIDRSKLAVGMQARVAYEVIRGEPVAFAIEAGFYPLDHPEGRTVQDIITSRRH